MLLAVPSGHRLADLARPIEDADLSDEPLIMHSPTKARYFYDLVVRMFPIQHANVVHTVSQILTMVSLVAASRGVAFVPHSATLLAIQGVEFLPLAEQRSERARGAARHLEPQRRQPGAAPPAAGPGVRTN